MADAAREALQGAAAADAEALPGLRSRIDAFGRALLTVGPTPSFFVDSHTIVASRERLAETAAAMEGAGDADGALWAEQVHPQLQAMARSAASFKRQLGAACEAALGGDEDAILSRDLAASGMTGQQLQVS